MRAHLLLTLSVVASSSLVRGATLDDSPLRATLDESEAALQQPGPRLIRKSLDDDYTTRNGSAASFPLDDSTPQVLPPPPRRVLRISLDPDMPVFEGRLIRLSLEADVYGRLNASRALGRHLRTSLD